MTNKKMYLYIGAFCLLGMFSSKTIFAVTLDDLSEGAKYGDTLIASGQGKIVYSFVREDSTSARALQEDQKAKEETPPNKFRVLVNTKRINLDFAFSGPKVRCDEKSIDLLPNGKTYPRHWQSRYDGEKVELLQLDGSGKNGLIRPKGSIRSDTGILRTDMFDPRYFANAILGVPVGNFLQGTSKDGKLEKLGISGEETLDGVVCTIVEAGVINSDIRYRVWIAPGQMYRPRKVEVRSATALKVVENGFRNCGGDIWFPELVTVKDYYFDPKTGAPVLEKFFTLTVSQDFQVNTDIPDSQFRMSFPKGLTVYDWRTGATFKAE